MSVERNCFTFIRGLIVKECDYDNIVKLLNDQNMGGRWLLEKRKNYYTFAGELYIFDKATYDNQNTLAFEIDKIKAREEFPEEIEREVSEIKEFDALIPAMEYNWESYHSSTNNAGHITIPAKELVNHLDLISQPQTFDLVDSDGNVASLNLKYYNNYNNSHSFVYIRKDLLDKYLAETNSKFIWVIWGERDVRFKTEERRQEYFKDNPFKEYQVFQKIIEYE